MSDKEILENYVNLEKIMSVRIRKERSNGYIYKYKDEFSLRDKIGTWPNIEVEIDVTDKSQFFNRPYHIKEEYKPMLDEEMKRLCYLGILKEGLSAYLSPVILISRKVIKDKSVVKKSDIWM